MKIFEERLYMQISIEDNALIYIYLKSKENHERVGNCLADVRCYLLYDDIDNLIGLKLFNTRDNPEISINGIPLIESINLPTVGYVDTPFHNSTITETEIDITIMFDGNAVINRVEEDVCNIDLCKEGILGIELIPVAYMGNKAVIMPFIIEDEPLTLTKLK